MGKNERRKVYKLVRGLAVALPMFAFWYVGNSILYWWKLSLPWDWILMAWVVGIAVVPVAALIALDKWRPGWGRA